MKTIYKNKINKDFRYLYEVPKDFELFIEKIYKNMEFCLNSRIYNLDSCNIILSNFIIYMLEENKKGIIRYESYNGTIYNKIPYYKWFLNNLNFFLLKSWDKNRKENRKLDRIKVIPSSIPVFVNQETLLFLKEIEFFLVEYSKNKYISSNFNKNVYDLFTYKMLDFSNEEIAKFFDMKIAIIYLWLQKLRILIKDKI